VLAEVTAREIGRVTIAEALELTALVARKQPHRYGRFAARWLCLWLEEHEKTTLESVEQMVSNLRALTTPKGLRLGARDPERGWATALTRLERPCPQTATGRATEDALFFLGRLTIRPSP
jgi:hypothetical protein